MGPPMTAEHGINGSDGHPVCLVWTCVAAVLAALVPGCIGHSCKVPWQGTGRTSVRCGRVFHAFPGGRPHTARGQTCSFDFHCKHSRAKSGAWSYYHALTFPLSTRPLKKESSDASSSTLPPSPCKRPSSWSCPPCCITCRSVSSSVNTPSSVISDSCPASALASPSSPSDPGRLPSGSSSGATDPSGAEVRRNPRSYSESIRSLWLSKTCGHEYASQRSPPTLMRRQAGTATDAHTHTKTDARVAERERERERERGGGGSTKERHTSTSPDLYIISPGLKSSCFR